MARRGRARPSSRSAGANSAISSWSGSWPPNVAAASAASTCVSPSAVHGPRALSPASTVRKPERPARLAQRREPAGAEVDGVELEPERGARLVGRAGREVRRGRRLGRQRRARTPGSRPRRSARAARRAATRAQAARISSGRRIGPGILACEDPGHGRASRRRPRALRGRQLRPRRDRAARRRPAQRPGLGRPGRRPDRVLHAGGLAQGAQPRRRPARRDLDRRPRQAVPDGARCAAGSSSRCDGDAALEIIDRMSIRYTGEPFPIASGHGATSSSPSAARR